MKKGLYYLAAAIVTVLCAIGGIELIRTTLPYSSENLEKSVACGAVILALGWVIGVLFEPKD